MKPRLISACAAFIVALGATFVPLAHAADVSDGKDAPSRAGDIKDVSVSVQASKGKAVARVSFYKNPDAFMYLNFMLGRDSYGMCFAMSSGGVWASFDPYDSGDADKMKGSIQATSVRQLGPTTWEYSITSKTIQKSTSNCFRIETAFMRDYERWDSDCECFTRVVDWDEVEGRI